MASSKFKILTVRMMEQTGGVGVAIEYGSETIERQIPDGHGLSRISAVIDEHDKLAGAQLITEKTA